MYADAVKQYAIEHGLAEDNGVNFSTEITGQLVDHLNDLGIETHGSKDMEEDLRRREEASSQIDIGKAIIDFQSTDDEVDDIAVAKSNFNPNEKTDEEVLTSAGYVKIGDIFVTPNFDKKLLQAIPIELFGIMQRAGVKILSMYDSIAGDAASGEEIVNGHAVGEISFSANTTIERAAHNFLHELGHFVYRNLNKEQKERANVFTSPVSFYVQNLINGQLTSGASVNEENFVEGFATYFHNKLFGSKSLSTKLESHLVDLYRKLYKKLSRTDDIQFAIDTDYVDLYDDEREDAYTYLEDEHAGRAIVRGDVGLYLIDHPGKGSIRRDKNGVPQGFQCKIKIDTRNLSEEQIREFENNIENGRIKDQRSADLWVKANIDQQRHDISNSIDIEVRGSNEDHDSLDLGSQAREPIRGLRDSDSQENSGESRLIKTGGDGTNFPRVIEVEDQRFITPQGQVYGYATPEGAIYLDERVIKKSRTCVRDFFIKACPPGQPDCLL